MSSGDAVQNPARAVNSVTTHFESGARPQSPVLFTAHAAGGRGSHERDDDRAGETVTSNVRRIVHDRHEDSAE